LSLLAPRAFVHNETVNILLVSPESLAWNSRAHIHNGLGYLAGALLRAGYQEVDIFDGAVERESLDDRLRREPFDIVGISSPTPLIHAAWRAAQVAGAHGALTILGGPHPTLMPDESLQRPQVDFVARGEGEDTLVEFVRVLESLAGPSLEAGHLRPFLAGPRAAFAQVRGLSYRDAAGGVIHNPPRPLARDLDGLALPAYHLFKIERYTNLQPLTDGLDRHARAYTIVTSRGCPYKCTYCSKPITGNTWRARSVDNVLAEWRTLVEELHATEIGITDDIWNLDLRRAKAICRGLIDLKLNHVPWITVHGMKVNHADAELFRLMKQAGCKRVGFGVESGDEQILKRSVKKSQTLEQVRSAFVNAKAAGLETMGFFIYGMPGETAETMERTTRLALELDPDLANFMMAAPYPGTELWDTVQREGKIYARDWSELAIHSDHAHFEIGALTPALVERKWHEAYRRFYFRPQRLARRLLRADTWRNLGPRLRDVRRFFAP
jgi:anaerobic magnesium-protoporphyrin IX monomethyl ester cyclase